MTERAALTSQELSIVSAVAATMKIACVLAAQRDQLVAEGGHTHESARDYLAAKWGAPDKPVADLIEWWDHECAYTTPAFSRILDAVGVSPQTQKIVLTHGAEADGIMSEMLAAVRRTH